MRLFHLSPFFIVFKTISASEFIPLTSPAISLILGTITMKVKIF